MDLRSVNDDGNDDDHVGKGNKRVDKNGEEAVWQLAVRWKSMRSFYAEKWRSA